MTINDILENGVNIQAIVEKYSSAKEMNCLKLTIVTQELDPVQIAFLSSIRGHEVTLNIKQAVDETSKYL
jgi:hypothetical protein